MSATEITDEPWYYHIAVLLPTGKVVDPKLNLVWDSVEAFRRGIVGDAKVTVMLRGEVLR